ncbi:hypothetical protein [uncultured Duncaniella sp.]|uniref:hypothetical protein n=1 Tax=uncultured Duncaniella sp. TaxID=2768039 RepID=UPI0025A946DB|nr:hypothetical protein [uncultured Duncaniella sp.]
MEDALRYIIIAVILYAVCMGIYKAVHTRKIDYCFWAIIGLFGIAIWLSRGFLITFQIYGWATWIVCLLTISSFLAPKKSKLSRWISGITLTSLTLSLIGFVILNIIADRKDKIVIETPLSGYSTARIDEIYFKYNGKSFERAFNLKDYSNIDDLLNGYNVELTIIPIAENIAKIDSLDLVPKPELIKSKGGRQ